MQWNNLQHVTSIPDDGHVRPKLWRDSEESHNSWSLINVAKKSLILSDKIDELLQ
jgi:hypothetical protein